MVVVLFFHAACSLRFIGLRVIRCLSRACVSLWDVFGLSFASG